jgi:hypothetical protein
MIVSEKAEWEEVNTHFYNQGWTDGLPIYPPTESRINDMLSGTRKSADTVLGKLSPRNREISVEDVAIQAVMAGCKSEYLPVILAALEALMIPEFNLFGIQTTTGSAAPALLINGPIIKDIELNAGSNCMGPFSRSNACIGRTVSLCLRNLGGAIPGKLDMATMGQPGKYTFCFGENESVNPWESLHIERGYNQNDSTVTVIGASGTIEVVDIHSTSATESLDFMAQSMVPLGTMNGLGMFGGGEPLVVFSPEVAAIIARDNFTKQEAKEYLFEKAQVHLNQIPSHLIRTVVENRKLEGDSDPNRTLTVAEKADDIMIVVSGGIGVKSTYIPTWGGGTRSVTKRIEL